MMIRSFNDQIGSYQQDWSYSFFWSHLELGMWNFFWVQTGISECNLYHKNSYQKLHEMRLNYLRNQRLEQMTPFVSQHVAAQHKSYRWKVMWASPVYCSYNRVFIIQPTEEAKQLLLFKKLSQRSTFTKRTNIRGIYFIPKAICPCKIICYN